MIGIYKIENLVNGKVYIGQSVDIYRRIWEHSNELKNNNHYNKYLQRAYNKYGEENFKFEIIEECEEDSLTEREQYWIDYYNGINSIDNYNFRDAGNKGKLSDITKQKLSELNLGKKHTEETKQKISLSNKGRYVSDETRRKISENTKGKENRRHKGSTNGMYGRHHTEETKRKISEHRKGLTAGVNNPNYGKKCPEKTKEAIRKANKGRIQSEEEKQKRIASMKKWYASDDYKLRKDELALKHTKYTPEIIQQLREEHKLLGSIKQVALNNNMNYEICRQIISHYGRFKD